MNNLNNFIIRMILGILTGFIIFWMIQGAFVDIIDDFIIAGLSIDAIDSIYAISYIILVYALVLFLSFSISAFFSPDRLKSMRNNYLSVLGSIVFIYLLSYIIIVTSYPQLTLNLKGYFALPTLFLIFILGNSQLFFFLLIAFYILFYLETTYLGEID